MADFTILPVIDLLAGQVVHGDGGDRAQYQPIRSRIAADSTPAAVAHAFRQLGCRQVYIADLDALAGATPQWSAYQHILRQGLSLWIDAGLSSPDHIDEFWHSCQARELCPNMILALESWYELSQLPDAISRAGASRLIMSIDLRDGTPLTRDPSSASRTPSQIFDIVVRAGFEQVIVLDLASVGRGTGCRTLSLCAEWHKRYPQVRLVTGGGVRTLDDLMEIKRAGCTAALVASALHQGVLRPSDLHGASA